MNNKIFSINGVIVSGDNDGNIFYKMNDEYGCFSNFAHYNFELDGKRWMTREHYF